MNQKSSFHKSPAACIVVQVVFCVLLIAGAAALLYGGFVQSILLLGANRLFVWPMMREPLHPDIHPTRQRVYTDVSPRATAAVAVAARMLESRHHGWGRV